MRTSYVLLALLLLSACGPTYTIQGTIDSQYGCEVTFQGQNLQAPASSIEEAGTEEVPTLLMCGEYSTSGVSVTVSLGRPDIAPGTYRIISGNFGVDPAYGTVGVDVPDPQGMAGGMRVQLNSGTVEVEHTAEPGTYRIRFYGEGKKEGLGH